MFGASASQLRLALQEVTAALRFAPRASDSCDREPVLALLQVLVSARLACKAISEQNQRSLVAVFSLFLFFLIVAARICLFVFLNKNLIISSCLDIICTIICISFLSLSTFGGWRDSYPTQLLILNELLGSI